MKEETQESPPLSFYNQVKEKSKKGIVAVLCMAVGFVLFHICGWFFPTFQFHATALLIYGIMIGAWYVVDKWILTKVDLQEQITKGQYSSIAVALTFVGHCILIVMAYYIGALTFFTLRDNQ